MMTTVPICVACKHNWYSAPGGCMSKPYPHSRCLFFQEDIPAVVEKPVGCDGTKSPKWTRSEVPVGCPTFTGARQ
jgi:hypothetical protein